MIVVKHEASDDAAGSYAAAAVAAKAIIWVAVGLGLYLLPEAARRRARRRRRAPDPGAHACADRRVAVPMVLVYAVAAGRCWDGLRRRPRRGRGRAPWLGWRWRCSRASTSAVQYLLALGRTASSLVLGSRRGGRAVLLLSVGATRQSRSCCSALQLVLAPHRCSACPCAGRPLRRGARAA